MAAGMRAIRRVVTGNDERGRSKVVWDGPAPQVHETKLSGRGIPTSGFGRRHPHHLRGIVMMASCQTIFRARAAVGTCVSFTGWGKMTRRPRVRRRCRFTSRRSGRGGGRGIAAAATTPTARRCTRPSRSITASCSPESGRSVWMMSNSPRTMGNSERFRKDWSVLSSQCMVIFRSEATL